MAEIKIEKIVVGGQGLGYYNEKPIFVWNVLPGEVAEVVVTKHRKGVYEGLATKIISSHKQRLETSDDHYLSCSPWRIMDYNLENELKIDLVNQSMRQLIEADFLPQPEYHFQNQRFGYRNKMEYSWLVEAGKAKLAFSRRDEHSLIACNGCDLADEPLLKTALQIEKWLGNGIQTRRFLKSLIVRSNGLNQTLAGLFVKDRASFINAKIDLDLLKGWRIYYSNFRSPASVIDDVLYEQGEDNITSVVGGKKLSFGLMSFMQVNLPMFELALVEIKKWVDGGEVLDLFSGVGAIGINLADQATKVNLVEINNEAGEFAQLNIEQNGLKNKVESECCPAEKALTLIKADQTVIVDPPRVGLTDKLIDTLLEVAPKRLVYLSCNPATQARDLTKLMIKYKARAWHVYNFFPATPHIESLIILDRK